MRYNETLDGTDPSFRQRLDITGVGTILIALMEVLNTSANYLLIDAYVRIPLLAALGTIVLFVFLLIVGIMQFNQVSGYLDLIWVFLICFVLDRLLLAYMWLGVYMGAISFSLPVVLVFALVLLNHNGLRTFPRDVMKDKWPTLCFLLVFMVLPKIWWLMKVAASHTLN